jgi:FMN-dependent NADH-azoreductase
MPLFRLDASIRVDGSQSREVADIVEREWRAARPDDPIVRRHVGTEPVPATAWADAVAGSMTPEDQRTPGQRDALAIGKAAADNMLSADALLFAAPLYNFGVSQHIKSWIDIAFTDPRISFGNPSPDSAGKPAALVIVRGGSYAPGTPREGWDHATGWLRRILADVWQLDLTVVETEFTLVGINPMLDEFADLAKQLRVEAEEHARQTGRQLATAAAR